MKRRTAVQIIQPISNAIPSLSQLFKSLDHALTIPSLEPSPIALEVIHLLERQIPIKIDDSDHLISIGRIATIFCSTPVLQTTDFKAVLYLGKDSATPVIRLFCLDSRPKELLDDILRYWNTQTQLTHRGATISEFSILKSDADTVIAGRFVFEGIYVEVVPSTAGDLPGPRWDISLIKSMGNPYFKLSDRIVAEGVQRLPKNTTLQRDEYEATSKLEQQRNVNQWIASVVAADLPSDAWIRVNDRILSHPTVATPEVLAVLKSKMETASQFEAELASFCKNPRDITTAKTIAARLGHRALPTFDRLIHDIRSRISEPMTLPLPMECLLAWEGQDRGAIAKADLEKVDAHKVARRKAVSYQQFVDNPTSVSLALDLASIVMGTQRLTRMPSFDTFKTKVNAVFPKFNPSVLDRLRWIAAWEGAAPQSIDNADQQAISTQVLNELKKAFDKPKTWAPNPALMEAIHKAVGVLYPSKNGAVPLIHEQAVLLRCISLIGPPPVEISTELKAAMTSKKLNLSMAPLLGPVHRWMESPSVAIKITPQVISVLMNDTSTDSQIVRHTLSIGPRLQALTARYTAMESSRWGTSETIEWIKQLDTMCATDLDGFPITFLSVLDNETAKMDRVTRLGWLIRLHEEPYLNGTAHYNAMHSLVRQDIDNVVDQICDISPKKYQVNRYNIDIQSLGVVVSAIDRFFPTPPDELIPQKQLITTIYHLITRQDLVGTPDYETHTDAIRSTPSAINALTRHTKTRVGLIAIGQLWNLLWSEKLSLMPIGSEKMALNEYKLFEKSVVIPLKKYAPLHALSLRSEGLYRLSEANTSTQLPELQGPFYKTIVNTLIELNQGEYQSQIPLQILQLVVVTPDDTLKSIGINKIQLFSRLFNALESQSNPRWVWDVKSNLSKIYLLCELSGISAKVSAAGVSVSFGDAEIAIQVTQNISPLLTHLMVDGPSFKTSSGWEAIAHFMDVSHRYHVNRFRMVNYGEQRSGITERQSGLAVELLISRLTQSDGSLTLSPTETICAVNAILKIVLFDYYNNHGLAPVIKSAVDGVGQLVNQGIPIPPQTQGGFALLDAYRLANGLYLEPCHADFETRYDQFTLRAEAAISALSLASTEPMSMVFSDTGNDLSMGVNLLLQQMAVYRKLIQLLVVVSSSDTEDSLAQIASTHLPTIDLIPDKLTELVEGMLRFGEHVRDRGDLAPLSSSIWNMTSGLLAFQILGWQAIVHHLSESIPESDLLQPTMTRLMTQPLICFDCDIRRQFAITVLGKIFGEKIQDAFINFNSKNPAPEEPRDEIPGELRFSLWWPGFADGTRIDERGQAVT